MGEEGALTAGLGAIFAARAKKRNVADYGQTRLALQLVRGHGDRTLCDEGYGETTARCAGHLTVEQTSHPLTELCPGDSSSAAGGLIRIMRDHELAGRPVVGSTPSRGCQLTHHSCGRS